MNSIKKFFEIEQSKVTTKMLLIYILLTYLFSITIRLFLYYQISDNGNLFYNSTPIPIWTPDAGLYGFYAEQLLNGISYPFISEYIPSYLLYWIVNLLGVSLDTALFFTPIFISSLIVIPILLMANHYKMVKIGIYATLFGSTMTGYYYRTHLGYYDTDILNATLPLFAIYFLIRLVDTKKILYILPAVLSLFSFYIWYHSSQIIIFSIIITFISYILLFHRKMFSSYFYILSIVIIIAILFSMDFSSYFDRANDYISKSGFIEVQSIKEIVKLKGDLGTVAEARSINFHELAYRVSGSTVYFIIALIGYFALLIKYRSMFLTFPILLLIFISTIAGGRFTLYGVALFSFSLVFGIEIVFKNILVRWGEYSQKVSTIVSGLFLLFVITFSIFSIIQYNKRLLPLYFSTKEDITALNRLKNSSTRDDFVITWWDYGWPLWYYSGVNTLIDNGKHAEDNFIVSKILLDNSNSFVRNASSFFIDKYIEGLEKSEPKVMKYFLKNYSIDYLEKLKKEDFKLADNKREIYILLHKNMLLTYNSIEMFSNFNLKTGKKYNSNMLMREYLKKEYNKKDTLLGTRSFSIDITNGLILSNKDKHLKIKKLIIMQDSKVKLDKNYSSLNNIYAIINNKRVFVMNKKLYNSFLVQSLFLNNYNSDYFEKIERTKNFLLLKIKKEEGLLSQQIL